MSSRSPQSVTTQFLVWNAWGFLWNLLWWGDWKALDWPIHPSHSSVCGLKHNICEAKAPLISVAKCILHKMKPSINIVCTIDYTITSLLHALSCHLFVFSGHCDYEKHSEKNISQPCTPREGLGSVEELHITVRKATGLTPLLHDVERYLK